MVDHKQIVSYVEDIFSNLTSKEKEKVCNGVDETYIKLYHAISNHISNERNKYGISNLKQNDITFELQDVFVNDNKVNVIVKTKVSDLCGKTDTRFESENDVEIALDDSLKNKHQNEVLKLGEFVNSARGKFIESVQNAIKVFYAGTIDYNNCAHIQPEKVEYNIKQGDLVFAYRYEIGKSLNKIESMYQIPDDIDFSLLTENDIQNCVNIWMEHIKSKSGTDKKCNCSECNGSCKNKKKTEDEKSAKQEKYVYAKRKELYDYLVNLLGESKGFSIDDIKIERDNGDSFVFIFDMILDNQHIYFKTFPLKYFPIAEERAKIIQDLQKNFGCFSENFLQDRMWECAENIGSWNAEFDEFLRQCM